jgi:hypothetical protein
MARAQRTRSVSIEDKIGLTTRIQREMESMLFNKERYDIDDPDHTKELVSDQLRQLAREKVVHELCIPPCSTDDSIQD